MSETHAALTWDGVGEKYYESGVSKVVLYPINNSGAYPKGVAWNGITAIDANPDGAEPNDFYADNIKYASLRSAEKFGGTIRAYTYPDEWDECNGFASPTGLSGMHIGQQPRKGFGLCYRTEESNDAGTANYKLHLVYGATASPSDDSAETINENPDLKEFSWDFDTLPVAVNTALTNGKPTSHIIFDAAELGTAKMTALEAILYGSTSADASLPLPDSLASTLAAIT